ncbi:adipokinetic hormone/corazonin-related peptide receptor variant I-like [Paramacrobiotus metropolitanus]|uniref:adipokinetic hormone/corazonin-related peptide receptor variant I-like n=1 Tax=Paramacrobiotus metropolitanus TaxID=2943436 RepID=UPI00244607E7|nr:adipokinetic hormone/corazonin-related peptide receptor variant I-like [Paramacrobiotus metropolitanus]
MPNGTMENATFPYLYNLPQEMQFTTVNVIVIAIYANLLWISLLGNIVVFVSLLRRKKKGRVHILLINLCVADTITTLVEMPLKIAWKWTVQWRGDDVSCRCVSFLRVLGLYLSALLLICISVDRFLAIWDPLSSVRQAGQRTRTMILLAWMFSVACAAPQAVIWHVMQHPLIPWYHQCVTFGSFPAPDVELFYGLGIMLLTYGLPLVVISACYLGIWIKIIQSSLQQDLGTLPDPNDRRLSVPSAAALRTSNADRLVKAKKRTLRMTVFIVGIFILCWSPYQIMSMWYFFDRKSAETVDQLGQEILFIFGVSSSVLNPYVYGIWSMGLWRNLSVLGALPCLKQQFQKAPPGGEGHSGYLSRAIGTDADGTDPERCSRGSRDRALSIRVSLPTNGSLQHYTLTPNSSISYTPNSSRRWAFGDMSNSFSRSLASTERLNGYGAARLL